MTRYNVPAVCTGATVPAGGDAPSLEQSHMDGERVAGAATVFAEECGMP